MKNIAGPLTYYGRILSLQIVENTDQLARAGERCDRENQHKASILSTLRELENIRNQKEALVISKTEGLSVAQNEPQRLMKWSETIEKAAAGIENELQALSRKIKCVQQEIERVGEQRKEAEKLRQSIIDKLTMNKNTIEKREDDVASMQLNLENARSQHHELITTKVELNLQRKECESNARHGNDELSLAKKSYDIMKRQVKKKIGIANSVKQVLAPLEGQLKDQEIVLRAFQNELEEKKNRMTTAKADVEANAMQFLRIDGIESEKKLVIRMIFLTGTTGNTYINL